jgi:alpha-galactosidase
MERRKFIGSGLLAAVSARLGGAAAPDGAEITTRPEKQKIVLVGAGSAMFTQGIIIDWLKSKPQGEWEIGLVDINPVILEATEKLVRRYMLTTDRPAKITASVDRKDILPGATAVVCTIGVGGRRAWEQDVFVPRKHGIYQPVGDSVMPGGVSRAMRMIPPMIDIARDAARLCPNAWFINYSNPMTAIVTALRRHTPVKAIGLCMGTEETIHYLAKLVDMPRSMVTARWVGVNHLTWITDIRHNGESLWPKLRAKVAAQRAQGIDRASWGGPFAVEHRSDKGPGMLHAPFSWELYDEFGAFPAPMDRHTTEYFPERHIGGKYYGSTLGVDAYSFEGTIAHGDRIYDETLELAKIPGPIPKERIEATGGEHEQMLEILESFRLDRRSWFAANIPNEGTVSNLPRNSVLEIPAIATAEGMKAPPIGDISAPLTAILMRRLAAVEAIVEAAVTGNRRLFAQALILDGGVYDWTAAEKLAADLIQAQKQHLPQFS